MKIKKQSTNKLLKIIPILMIVCGIGLLAIYAYYHFTGVEVVPLPKVAPENAVVDEKDVTEDQKQEHQVPAKDPRYLSIDGLGIKKARILNVGLKDGSQIDSPAGIFDVGWFNQSARQGEKTNQAIVLDGHNGGPTRNGVFKFLPDLEQGSEIVIERGDGKISKYRVVENYQKKTSEIDQQMMSALNQARDDKETLTIISCSGRWIPAQETYDHRVIVRATLKDN